MLKGKLIGCVDISGVLIVGCVEGITCHERPSGRSHVELFLVMYPILRYVQIEHDGDGRSVHQSNGLAVQVIEGHYTEINAGSVEMEGWTNDVAFDVTFQHVFVPLQSKSKKFGKFAQHITLESYAQCLDLAWFQRTFLGIKREFVAESGVGRHEGPIGGDVAFVDDAELVGLF